MKEKKKEIKKLSSSSKITLFLREPKKLGRLVVYQALIGKPKSLQ